MSRPYVTIGIPTRNRASLIKATAQAALTQTVPEIEVVISDNASTDGTHELLHDIRDPRVRIMRQQQNIGMAPNWNACLAEAAGDWFVLLSDDDIIDPDFVEAYLDAARNCPGAAVVLGPARMLCKSNTDVLLQPDPLRSARIADLVIDCLNGELGLHLCGFMFHTATLRLAGGFNTTFAFSADSATWLPLVLTRRTAIEQRAHATYVFHRGSLTYSLGLGVLINDEARLCELVKRYSNANEFITEEETVRLRTIADRRVRVRPGEIVLTFVQAGISKMTLLRECLQHFKAIVRYPRLHVLLAAFLIPRSQLARAAHIYRRILGS
jgi:glycosyltransferase involved in cell wall biosynthesis